MKANPDKNLNFSKKRLWGGRAERKATYKGIRHNIKDELHKLVICPDCESEDKHLPENGPTEIKGR